MVEQTDVIVVGMGVGGEDVAGRLAEAAQRYMMFAYPTFHRAIEDALKGFD